MLREPARSGRPAQAAPRAAFDAIAAALYGGRAWDGKAFWRTVKPWLRKGAVRRAAPVPPALPPLFRLQGGS